MKLKEKFEEIEIMFESQTGSLKYDELNNAADECVKIADEFTIDFVEWLCDNEITKEEIKTRLEIYKKENKL